MSSGMKPADARQKTPDELKSQLLDLKKEQFNLRFQRASGQLENTARVRVIRRDIARIRTVLSERAKQASAGQAKVGGAKAAAAKTGSK